MILAATIIHSAHLQLTVFFVDEVGPANRFSPLALERGMIKEWKKIFEVDLLFRNFWA